MPNATGSDYNQASFVGGFSLLGDDSRLNTNQYRIGFNLTNRFDELDLIPSSVLDLSAPIGIKQAVATFGNYIVLFVAGQAFYKYYSDIGWQSIPSFSELLSITAARYWTCAVPLALTNYVRYSIANALTTSNGNTLSSPAAGVNLVQVEGAAQGNLPGILVQDNINQPVYIYLDANGLPTARVTQNYSQWNIQYTDITCTVVATDANGNPEDYREYVPIGNCMAWSSGILFIVAQDFNSIYRSVSGRPLDFVVNVNNTGSADFQGFQNLPGGDATTTSTSVGVGGISCIRPLSSGGIFVSASGANFSLVPNTTPNAPTIFGEYTFIRTFLFNAYCLSDRAIIDSLGDTKFIDLTGIRSFNAVQQLQNEGRNSLFSNSIQGALNGLVQNSVVSSAVLFDNYEIYSVNTIFGKAFAKYDTINSCWTSFDNQQAPNARVKQFAALQINVLALYGITEDDKFYQFYASPTKNDTAVFRTVGVCANLLYANISIKMNNPKSEVKLNNTRVIVNKITEDTTIGFTPFVNNRVSGGLSKTIVFSEAAPSYSDSYTLPDINTQLTNILFPTPDIQQGWKVFGVFTWNSGTITQFSMELSDLTPMNPLTTQGQE